MNIAIIGGGNVGTLMAAEFAHKGHSVTVCTSRPEGWSRSLEVYGINGEFLFSAGPVSAVSDMGTAVRGADIVFVTLPAEYFRELADRMLPHVRAGLAVGIVPGSGGAEFAFRELIARGCRFFGFQRVHSIARLKEKGRAVSMLGRKSELQLACIPQAEAPALASVMEGLFDMPCRVLPNYLAVTLTPSNPILHTTRLYSMFRSYHGQPYDHNILFYEEWDDASSEILLRCDDELQRLCTVLPMDLSDVKSLRVHYESPDAPAMTRKISGIPAFAGLTSPMRMDADGWRPDFGSRYFSTDFSYGLKILRDICHLFDVPCPGMEEVWGWYEELSRSGPAQRAAESLRCFELNLSKDEFARLYRLQATDQKTFNTPAP